MESKEDYDRSCMIRMQETSRKENTRKSVVCEDEEQNKTEVKQNKTGRVLPQHAQTAFGVSAITLSSQRGFTKEINIFF